MTVLVIVESPGKIKKIKSLLGNGYLVKASMGIIRDLNPKELAINLKSFKLSYIITKPKIVKELKKCLKNVDIIYLASDKDREGEQIAQSLLDVLKPKKYYRLLFNSITKKSIMDAIENKCKIDNNLVDAQKSRRIIDRLYGYLVSPILTNNFKKNLSAGRVQSITVKLIAEKDHKIEKLIKENKNSFYRIDGIFDKLKTKLMLNDQIAKIKTKNDAIRLLRKLLKSEFKINEINKTESKRQPPPPFTTSTLQQEGITKLKVSANIVMSIAQKLYEGGFITYMRTDSTFIADECHPKIKKVISEKYGKQYYQKKIYENNSSFTQEAHECCRPTDPLLIGLSSHLDDPLQIELYDLIWKRTMASQMKDAIFDVYQININISNINTYYFQNVIEKCIFLGYLKIYKDSIDTCEINYKVGDMLLMDKITASEEYQAIPLHYSQASLIKKMEKIGIGRPSTYAAIIETILKRKYIEIADIPGISKECFTLEIRSKNKIPIMEIIESSKIKIIGKEKNKLIITDLGITVNDFLNLHFADLMDYAFTNKMEKGLDEIARGEKNWKAYVADFYHSLSTLIAKYNDNC